MPNNYNGDERRQEERQNIHNQLGILLESVKNIKDDINEFKTSYVTKIEFAPVKTIAFGLVGMLLLGILTAILKLVVK